MRYDPATDANQDYAEVIGRVQQVDEVISSDRIVSMDQSLDVEWMPVSERYLPPGYHWLYFNRFAARRATGLDGHPKPGVFIPDFGLPRRMWAGSRIRYLAPIEIGASATRTSTIIAITKKPGQTGDLVFVTLRHRVFVAQTTCIEEEQDIVYRDIPKATPMAHSAPIASQRAEWSHTIVPDPVLLFRYSALTSNAHRIHFDEQYARTEEGYSALVVHGPLVATLLQGLVTRYRGSKRLSAFTFRAAAPLFVDRPLVIEALSGKNGDSLTAWARDETGNLAVQAQAELSDT